MLSGERRGSLTRPQKLERLAKTRRKLRLLNSERNATERKLRRCTMTTTSVNTVSTVTDERPNPSELPENKRKPL